MSHVDEGALHAYLDGALDEYPAAEARRIREHVETCAECAERLEAERMVREDAHAILGLAAPQVAVPTFEELRAYVVRTSRAERSTMSVRLYRMSWAASVVLALGTGWMLRGERAVVVAPLQQSGGAEPSALAREQEPERDAQPTAADAVPLQSVEERAASAPSETQVTAAPGRVPAPALDVAVDARALGAAAAPGVRAEMAQTQGPPPVAEPLVDARDFDDVSLAGGAGGLAAGATAAAAPPAPSAPSAAPQAASTRVAERIDSAARANQAERRVVAQDQVVTSSLSADQGAPAFRQRPTNEQVAVDEEPVSLVVPGLEVLDVLPVGQGTAFAGVRALQRLESGDTLELVHLPEQVDPSLLPPRRPGTNELVRQTGSGWLVMRAPVTERYLQELLQRLEGGR